MDSFFDNLKQLASEIERAEGIEVNSIFADWLPEKKRENIDRFAQRYRQMGLPVQESWAHLTVLGASLKLNWTASDWGLLGAFEFQDLLVATFKAAGKKLPLYEDMEIPEAVIDRYKAARYFDWIQDVGVGCLMLSNGSYDFDQTWFYDETDHYFYPLCLSIDTYYNMAVLLKGALYWQLFFTDPESASKTVAPYQQRQMLELVQKLPLIFPNHDYAELLEAYKKWRPYFDLRHAEICDLFAAIEGRA